MNKLSKVFLVIIIILMIALTFSINLYLKAIKMAEDNLNQILEIAEEAYNLYIKIDELEKELETYKTTNSISTVTNSTPAHVVENPDISNNSNDNSSNNKTLDIRRFPEKVSLKVLEDTITRDGATLVITDENEEPYGYGEDFVLEVKKGDSWVKVESLPNTVWKSLAYVPNDEGELTMKLNFKYIFGSLEDGIYRVVKTIQNVERYSNEFEIK